MGGVNLSSTPFRYTAMWRILRLISGGHGSDIMLESGHDLPPKTSAETNPQNPQR